MQTDFLFPVDVFKILFLFITSLSHVLCLYGKYHRLKVKKIGKRKHSPCEWQDLHFHSFLPHSCCLLLLALAPGAWHWFFGWVTDLTPFCPPPPLHLPLSQSCLLCSMPFSVLYLARQVSGIIVWNPAKQKQSTTKTYKAEDKITESLRYEGDCRQRIIT